MIIDMPKGAADIIAILTDNGYEAFLAGGCVRDSLMGKAPHDYDICTSATPGEVYNCVWETFKIFETGIDHGTVTVVAPDGNYEVTTYRIDGEYSDGRRPDSVEFTSDLRLDMSRRDFTINAMAYNHDIGLCDFFGGQRDLHDGIIVCVGEPEDRFKEDALRILRALRFASVLGFKIESKTSQAIHDMKSRLQLISAERITMELIKLLAGVGACNVLIEYSDVFAEIIPELQPCIGFEQNNRFHQYTVYDHIAHAVGNYDGGDHVVNLSLLLHDIGKPAAYFENETGGHFYGHGEISYELAKVALSRLRLSTKDTEDILALVRHHDAVMEPTRKVVRRWMNRIGHDQFERLLAIRIADIMAHAENTQESRIERWRGLRDAFLVITEDMYCFSLKDLAVNGHDVMALGVKEGKQVGNILKALLDKVIDEELINDRQVLLNAASEVLNTESEE